MSFAQHFCPDGTRCHPVYLSLVGFPCNRVRVRVIGNLGAGRTPLPKFPRSTPPRGGLNIALSLSLRFQY